MSKKVPYDIAKQIKQAVFQEADDVRYLSQSRTSNGVFLEQLISKPEIGGRLAEYMAKTEVKTYIKDAILNRYSKDKLKENKPSDLKKIIHSTLSLKNAEHVESAANQGIELYKAGGKFVVVADGTYLKWETAMRKALLYIASKPFGENKNSDVFILLTLFARQQKVVASENKYLAKALAFCKGYIYIYGEK
jgi:hypothetical protein